MKYEFTMFQTKPLQQKVFPKLLTTKLECLLSASGFLANLNEALSSLVCLEDINQNGHFILLYVIGEKHDGSSLAATVFNKTPAKNTVSMFFKLWRNRRAFPCESPNRRKKIEDSPLFQSLTRTLYILLEDLTLPGASFFSLAAVHMSSQSRTREEFTLRLFCIDRWQWSPARGWDPSSCWASPWCQDDTWLHW